MSGDTVTVNISSTASSIVSEKRFPTNISILEFKGKLELISGCQAAMMKLQLFTADDKLLKDLNDNAASLSSYSIANGMRVHITDPSVKLGQFDDVSKVQKYELSNEEYAQKKETLRAFKERNKLGQFKEVTPEEKMAKEAELAQKIAQEKTAFDKLKLGDRCRITLPAQPQRLACIKYLGQTSFKEGLWVGVQYDEPVGKNDGSVDGRKYFSCSAKFGGFVKPTTVEAGNFPPDDLGLSDDEM